MKKIQLTQGKCALVDDDDYENLNLFKWYYNDGYAVRNENGNRVRMHRQIMNPKEKFDVDHVDHNGINNQKHNLRICTRSQNKMNSIKNRGISKFKGVSIAKRVIKGKEYKYYRSRILIDGKAIEVTFPYSKLGEINAARCYNDMAIRYFGEFANINNL